MFYTHRKEERQRNTLGFISNLRSYIDCLIQCQSLSRFFCSSYFVRFHDMQTFLMCKHLLESPFYVVSMYKISTSYSSYNRSYQFESGRCLSKYWTYNGSLYISYCQQDKFSTPSLFLVLQRVVLGVTSSGNRRCSPRCQSFRL